MRHWTSQILPDRAQVRLLVTDEQRHDVLKARLPPHPSHPRALLTLLEGLALYSGQRLCTVICAADESVPWLGSGLFGDEWWPAESSLVQFEIAEPGRRRRLRGLGDFGALRKSST